MTFYRRFFETLHTFSRTLVMSSSVAMQSVQQTVK